MLQELLIYFFVFFNFKHLHKKVSFSKKKKSCNVELSVFLYAVEFRKIQKSPITGRSLNSIFHVNV